MRRSGGAQIVLDGVAKGIAALLGRALLSGSGSDPQSQAL
jgi:hypothetical protein